jgi:endonuclease/exonuclease/phosphatase (EEP) superfamily protein YafD
MGFLTRTVVRLFWFCLALLVLVLAAGTLSALYADRIWYCELATHFQLQYVVLLSIVTVLFALDARYKWAVFSLVVAASAFSYHLLPLYAGGRPEDKGPRTLRLVSSNIAFFNQTKEALLTFIAAEKPDVILLYEVSDEWTDTLKKLEATYPHFQVAPRKRHAGIAIFSRLPLENLQVPTVGKAPSPVITATVVVNELKFTVMGAHPDPPVTWTDTLERNDQLEGLAELVVSLPTPLVLAADLNTSSWNPVFQRLIDNTGLRDSRRGFGVQASWSTKLPLLRTTIDHCLVSPRVKVLDRRLGPNIGSDHFPIVVDLLVK